MDPLSTIIIYVIRICGLCSNVSMLVIIDTVFYGPQILIPFDCRGATVGERGPWRGCLLIQYSSPQSTYKDIDADFAQQQ
jgi:hypothetical protein